MRDSVMNFGSSGGAATSWAVAADDASAASADASVVAVPSADLLLHAEIKRSGSDLILIGQDGERFVVTDYFKHERPPALRAPDGSVVTGDAIAAVVAAQTPLQYAQNDGAGEAPPDMIGKVDRVSGAVNVTRNGVSVQLNAGDDLRKGDVIQTASDATVVIMMVDGTALDLSASTQMVLNEFIFTSGSTSNSSLLTLVRGAFASVSGQIASTGGLNVATAVATMGIRGTEFAASCTAGCTFGAAQGSTYQLFYNGVAIATVTYSSSPTLTPLAPNQLPQISFATSAPPEMQQQITQLVQIYPQISLPTFGTQPDNQPNSNTAPGSSTPPFLLLLNTNPGNQHSTAGASAANNAIVLPGLDAALQTSLTIPFLNQGPLSRPIADQHSREESPWLFMVPGNTFVDPEGRQLIFTASLLDGAQLPNWLHFDPVTLTFFGTPPAEVDRSLPIRIIASDGISSVASIFTLFIDPLNVAPVVVGGNSALLAAIGEDTNNPGGATVASMLASHFSDASDQMPGGPHAGSNFAGIAISGNAATAAQGTWQYFHSGQWISISTSVSESHALTLAAGTLIRFVPAANFNGPVPPLTVHLMDDFAGPVVDGHVVDLVAGGIGGETPFSSETVFVGTTVGATNDAPVVINGEAVALPSILEDAGTLLGATLASLLGPHFSDAADNQTANGGSSANTLAGFAIYGNPSSPAGTWQWSSDGASWSPIDHNLSDSHAFVLTSSALIRFVPAENYNGEAPQLIGRLIDSSGGQVTNGSFADLTSLGEGTTPYSSASINIGETVISVNDSPVVLTSHISRDFSEDAPVQSFTAADLLQAIGASDVDGDALKIVGLALIGSSAQTIDLANPPAGVRINLAPDGSLVALSVDPDAFEYLPAGRDFTLTANFLVSDGHGGLTPASASLTIDGLNDRATIDGDTYGRLCEDETTPATGTLSVRDVDEGENHARVAAGSGIRGLGSYSVDADGHWSYTLDNAAVQHLGACDHVTDSFTVESLDGTASRIVTITIDGVNDRASIDGDTHGRMSEDDARATGALLVSDVDDGENQAIAASGRGDHCLGNYRVDADGNWCYILDNEAVQHLAAGTHATDSFTVESLDGSACRLVTITIDGVNDTASIEGDSCGRLCEDETRAATGRLSVCDVDDGESHVKAASGSGDHGLGSYNIGADGCWSYILDNEAVQHLAAGTCTTDSFTVQSFDGSASRLVTITIDGVNDPASICVVGAPDVCVTEDSLADSTAGGTLRVNDVDDGENVFAAADAGSCIFGRYGTFTFNATTGVWTYALDNTNPAVDALNDDCDPLHDTLTVHSADRTACYDIDVTIIGHTDRPPAAPPVAAFGLADPNDNDSASVGVTPTTADFSASTKHNDIKVGGAGNDTINGGQGDDILYGRAGNDIINGNNDDDTIYGQSGNDSANGGSGSDIIYGGSGVDTINGSSGDETIYAGSGNDLADGGDGNDTIVGGYGADTLSGGAGNNCFKFLSTLDTGDTITDFQHGRDKIDLSAIDANTSTTPANEEFAYGGQSNAVGPNSVTWTEFGGKTFISVDVNGDTTADLQIKLAGTGHGLTSSDFVL